MFSLYSVNPMFILHSSKRIMYITLFEYQDSSAFLGETKHGYGVCSYISVFNLWPFFFYFLFGFWVTAEALRGHCMQGKWTLCYCSSSNLLIFLKKVVGLPFLFVCLTCIWRFQSYSRLCPQKWLLEVLREPCVVPELGWPHLVYYHSGLLPPFFKIML